MSLGFSRDVSKLCVSFQYGDPTSPTYLRYTRWDENVTIGANTYTPNRKIDIELPADRGDLDEGAATLKLEVSDALTTALAEGRGHSPIHVVIYEVVESVDGLTTTVLTLFKGRVAQTVANYQGVKNVIALKVLSYKHLLLGQLGLQCNPQCGWTLAGTGCPVIAAGLAQTGTLTVVSRATVTITGVTAAAYFGGGSTDRYWHRGYVERDGLRIGIREWKNAEATTFHLVRVPPSSWDGQSVSVFPGCDKTVETCRARWNAESGFGGMGFAMPAYKPQFENAPGG